MADTTSKEKLITEISLEGVELTQRGQKAVGAGFRALRGDIKGAAAELDGFKLTTAEQVGVGGAMVAAGAGMLAYMRSASVEAANAERVQDQYTRGMMQGAGATQAQAEALSKYLDSLSAANGKSAFTDEELKISAQMLASFKMNASQVKEYIPAVMDLAAGYRDAEGNTISLQKAAIMLGKAHVGNTAGLRKMGIMVDENAFKTKGYKAVLEEINKEFGGQSAEAMGTAWGQTVALNDAMGELNESIGTGLVPVIKSITPPLRTVTNFIKSANDATHGWAGASLAIGAGLLVVTGGVLMVMPGIKALRDMWLEVAGAATTATAAQKAASTAGAGASATAATGGAAGKFGGMGGALGKLGKAFGIMAILGLAGDMAKGLADGTAKNAADPKTRSDANAMKSAVGYVGGNALKGAGIGAGIGSVVPVVGTAAGGIIGGAGGALYGVYEAYKDRKGADAEYAKANPRSAKSPVEKTNDKLDELIKLMGEQNKAIIGGGSRTATALNKGDIDRAIMGTLARGVV